MLQDAQGMGEVVAALCGGFPVRRCGQASATRWFAKLVEPSEPFASAMARRKADGLFAERQLTAARFDRLTVAAAL